jgi:uncharacterized protein
MMTRAVFSAVAMALIVPVAAQAQFSESYNFLKGVRDRDGEAVTKIIQKPGSGAVIVNTRDASTGEGALHIVTKRRDTAWLSFLLSKGADSNMRDRDGNSALMLASQLSYAEGISLLLDRRANVDLANNSGETPLIRAVQLRDLATVRTLLAAGANPNKADTGAGLSARQYAERDPRAGAILAAINDAKPKAKPKIGPS